MSTPPLSPHPAKESGSVPEPSLPPVHVMRPEERRRVTQVLARAFFDDPVAIHLFPAARRRGRAYELLMALEIDAFGRDGIVLTDDATQGAAIWRRPNPTGTSRIRGLTTTLRAIGIMRLGTRRLIDLMDAVAGRAPPQPFYYLSTIGTDPAAQGRGVGSALIRTITDRADQEGVAAYLESSKAANVPYYQRHGFEVEHEVAIRNGPKLWTMLRSPR